MAVGSNGGMCYSCGRVGYSGICPYCMTARNNQQMQASLAQQYNQWQFTTHQPNNQKIQMSPSSSFGGRPAISFSSPNFPHPIDLREGMYIVLVTGRGRDSSPNANPIWGENGQFLRGIVRQIDVHHNNMRVAVFVEWEHGISNEYIINDGSCEILPVEFATKPKKAKAIKLDGEKLDALIIDPSTKNEIIAVLKQHQNREKLFTTWGLGDTIEYGRGMGFMFHGTPGTGKTHAAHCIARALGMELLVISASEIQSSEPGGANRAIQEAFKAAKDKHQVLFLDECDSLITQRNDVGMILSSEINTLLTEIEKFEGVCILATNRIETMDAALERRISLIVKFPFPNESARKQIWEKLLPKKMPLGEDVKVEELAKVKLSGGEIKNILLQAARLACGEDAEAVTKVHFDAAIARFNQSKGLMGQESRYRQGRKKEDFERGEGGSVVKTKEINSFLTDELGEEEDKK